MSSVYLFRDCYTWKEFPRGNGLFLSTLFNPALILRTCRQALIIHSSWKKSDIQILNLQQFLSGNIQDKKIATQTHHLKDLDKKKGVAGKMLLA